VAARWGSLRLTDGKVVWALLAGGPEAPPAAPHQRESAGMTDPARG